MADLIDRAALLVDIDELHEHCGHCDGYGYISKDKTMQKVKAAPAVDAVEVVRCGECRFRGKLYASHLCQHPNALLSKVEETDFCSYGKRRTDETD